MLRIAKTLLVMLFVIGFFGAVSLGFLFILSGGDPYGYARTTWLSIQLASRQDDLEAVAGSDSTNRIFEIAQGDSAALIAQNLYDDGLINDAQLFFDYLIVEGIDRNLKSGIFFLNQQQTIPEIAYTLTDFNNAGVRFEVFAGQRIEEIAASVDANPRLNFSGDEFLAYVGVGAEIDPYYRELYSIPVGATLEGFLAPGLVYLPPDITAEGLRDTMFGAFTNVFTAQMRLDAAEQGLSVYDVVTLASIVERESVHADENPQIARVYLNRLEQGMRLDADPTVQYALQGSRGSWWSNITQADYRGVQSPYNTYLNFGLPPSPISNPSIPAINSVIYPAETDFLFFRARCDGSFYHVFALTYEQHLNNGC